MDRNVRMQWAKEKWQLQNLNVIYEEKNKAVYSAKSERWGAVILKINENLQELATEYAFLQVKNAPNCCKVYGYVAEQRCLLEEQILPGDKLVEERELYVRLEDFARVFEGLHGDKLRVEKCEILQGKSKENQDGENTSLEVRAKGQGVAEADNQNQNKEEAKVFENYLDWLRKAECFCVEHNVDVEITDKMTKARTIGEEMFTKYPERILLHGDLHHHNILLNEAGSYCVIDPKGVIGPAIFDLPRFLLNELGYAQKGMEKQHILRVSHFLSDKMGYPQEDIIKLFYMEKVLANVWCLEDGEKVIEEWRIDSALEWL